MNWQPVDLALKGVVVLAAAALAARLMQRGSAAAAHRVWLLGMMALLVVPAAGIALPQKPVRVLPQLSAEATFSAVPRSRPIPQPAGHHDAAAAATQRQAESGFAAEQRASMPGTAVGRTGRGDDAASARSMLSAVRGGPWPTILMAVWAVVAAMLVLRLAIQQVMLRRLLGRCEPVSDDAWTTAVAEACTRLDVKRRVRLVKTATALTPATAGAWWPIVIVPGQAAGWTASRRRSVLLHEVAHIKRWDVLAQTFSAAACALHWFNPLAWYGLAQMRNLRELACDDLVLTCGQSPEDYAETLLDVARSLRPARYAAAVGMARGTNVEHRIVAILDAARHRMPLSRRAALMLGSLALTLAVGLGALRLESRASDAATASDSARATSAPVVKQGNGHDPALGAREVGPDGGETALEVLITDEDGNPLPAATVQASYWCVEGGKAYPTRTFAVDESGLARVPRPRRLDILRLWPDAAKYVPQFLGFESGTHDEGAKIPGRLHFRLARGTIVGGRIVDEAGRPIAGARVEVSLSHSDRSTTGWNDEPKTSTWLTDETSAPVTDADGRWAIDNAPARPHDDRADHDFLLKVTCDGFASDTTWGEHQRAQGITTKMLRDGEATIKFERGVVIEGTVVDAAGNPVSRGLVIWNDDPYLAQGVNEVEIDRDGRFKTLPLSPGEYPITVAAPGYAPDRLMVRAAPGMQPLRLEVMSGKKLTIQIVDRHGKPIPHAYVGIGEWRHTKSLFNQKHPNVPESDIPRQADADGVYTWDWAPDDAVDYTISFRGYSGQDVTLVAGATPHVVSLPDAGVVVGTVTDQKSGKPIPQFSAIPVIENVGGILFAWTPGAKVGRDGRYELPLEGSSDPDARYRVRFEADGYRSTTSQESFGESDGRTTLDMTLLPADMRRGLVVDTDGRPIPDAHVVVATVTDRPILTNDASEWGLGHSITTDDQGLFAFRPSDESAVIRAIHDRGFAEVRREPDEAVGTLTLQPWARLEGRFLQEGVPVAHRSIAFSRTEDSGYREPRIQDRYEVDTDADGRFVFDRLPPVAGSVWAESPPRLDVPPQASESVPLSLRPGERRTIDLGAERGAAVTGRVVPVGREVVVGPGLSSWLISRDRGIPLPADAPKLGFHPREGEPPELAWLDDPRFFGYWLATRVTYAALVAPGGGLRIEGVPAGSYDLVIELYDEADKGAFRSVGRRIVPVEVTEADVAGGEKPLGEVEVPCVADPRVGDDMQNCRFIDGEGRERTVGEMRGKYVVLHVWASWSRTALETMPEIQKAADAVADDAIVFVGLNVDIDTARAKAFVTTHGLGWSQTYLGPASETGRQLAITTAPAYFLIGRDGKLAASSTDWRPIKNALDAALDEEKPTTP